MSRLIAERLKARRLDEFRHNLVDIDEWVPPPCGRFDLHDELALWRAVNERDAPDVAGSDGAANRNRNVSGIADAVETSLPQGSAEFAQRKAAQRSTNPDETRGVLAFLRDDMIRVPQDDQSAARLDRAGDMDPFTFAI